MAFQHLGPLAIVDFGVWDALRDVLLLLVAALLLGTIAERLRQSVIVGYLIAGTVVGPNVLGWISKQQELYYIAELGVALLLFEDQVGQHLAERVRRVLSVDPPAATTE